MSIAKTIRLERSFIFSPLGQRVAFFFSRPIVLPLPSQSHKDCVNLVRPKLSSLNGGLQRETLSPGASKQNCAIQAHYRSSEQMSLKQHAGPRGFFHQVAALFFGTVRSTVTFKTPVSTAKASCGTVWQLLSM